MSLLGYALFDTQHWGVEIEIRSWIAHCLARETKDNLDCNLRDKNTLIYNIFLAKSILSILRLVHPSRLLHHRPLFDTHTVNHRWPSLAPSLSPLPSQSRKSKAHHWWRRRRRPKMPSPVTIPPTALTSNESHFQLRLILVFGFDWNYRWNTLLL